MLGAFPTAWKKRVLIRHMPPETPTQPPHPLVRKADTLILSPSLLTLPSHGLNHPFLPEGRETLQSKHLHNYYNTHIQVVKWILVNKWILQAKCLHNTAGDQRKLLWSKCTYWQCEITNKTALLLTVQYIFTTTALFEDVWVTPESTTLKTPRLPCRIANESVSWTLWCFVPWLTSRVQKCDYKLLINI